MEAEEGKNKHDHDDEADKIEASRDTENEDEDDSVEGMIAHTFNLRPAMSISIDLPEDFTAAEAERLSHDLRCFIGEDQVLRPTSPEGRAFELVLPLGVNKV